MCWACWAFTPSFPGRRSIPPAPFLHSWLDSQPVRFVEAPKNSWQKISFVLAKAIEFQHVSTCFNIDIFKQMAVQISSLPLRNFKSSSCTPGDQLSCASSSSSWLKLKNGKVLVRPFNKCLCLLVINGDQLMRNHQKPCAKPCADSIGVIPKPCPRHGRPRLQNCTLW